MSVNTPIVVVDVTENQIVVVNQQPIAQIGWVQGLDDLSDVTKGNAQPNSDVTIRLLADPNNDGNYVEIDYTPPSGGGGEVNALLLQGTGLDISLPKTSPVLPIKGLIAQDARITVIDGANNNIEFGFGVVSSADLSNSAEIVLINSTQVLTNKTIDTASNTITILAADVSDFDTEVSNNFDVVANTAKISADGSVTTHSDVTDAGSGAIITTTERADIVANNAKQTFPAGGTQGQLLVKLSATDYDTSWEDIPTSFSGTWRFNTDTTATQPADGKFKLNAATQATTTAVYISSITDYDFNLDFFLNSLVVGEVFSIIQNSNAKKAALYEISATPTDNTGWWTIPVTFIQQSTQGEFESNVRCTFEFYGLIGGSVNELNDLNDVNTTPLGSSTLGTVRILADVTSVSDNTPTGIYKTIDWTPPTGASLAIVENGFDDRTQTVLSFDNLTRTFTIAPLATNYTYVFNGTQFTKSTPENIVIADTAGSHYIYFDGANLQETEIYDDTLITQFVFIATVYWDSISQENIYFGDHRYERRMDAITKVYNNRTFGARFEGGLEIQNIIADGSGNLDTSAQIAVQDGFLWDEDLRVSIVNGAPQTLAPIAQLPIFYREGAAGDWRKFDATDFPVTTTGTGRLAFNEFTGTVWQLSETPNLDFALAHIYAGPNLLNPVAVIMGQNAYSSVGQARTGAEEEIRNLSYGDFGPLLTDLLPIATIIFQTSNGYTNQVKSRIRSTDSGADYVDWRFNPVGSSNSSSLVLWGNIFGDITNQLDLQVEFDTLKIEPIESSYATVEDKTYTISLYAIYAYRLNTLHIQTVSGTCIVTIQINGANVIGMTSISVSSTLTTVNATAANNVSIGQSVTMVVTGSSSVEDLSLTLATTRT